MSSYQSLFNETTGIFSNAAIKDLSNTLIACDSTGTVVAATAIAPLTYTAGTTQLSLGYNTSNLKITSSLLNTIQDITTVSTPEFAALKLTTGAGAGKYLQSDASGNTSWQSIISVSPSALSKVDDTNITLTLGGTPSTALLQATSITAGWNGQLSMARGGTNANLTAAVGSIVYSSSTALALLSPPASNNCVLLGQTATNPIWSTCTYPSTVATGDLLYGSSTNVVGKLAIGANTYVLTSDGTNMSWQPGGGAGAVSSVSGTANQITVSPTTGACVVSLPSVITAPGTLGITTMNETNIISSQYNGGILYTSSTGVLKQNPYELFYNNLTSRVGINTNIPSNTLHVVGDGAIIEAQNGSTTTISSYIITIGSGGGTNAYVLLGYDFTVSSRNLIISAIGSYAQGGSFADTFYQVAIYDYTSGVQIYSCNVLNSATTEADGFKYYTLPTPFTLTAGTKYQILTLMTNTPLIYRTDCNPPVDITINRPVSIFGSSVAMQYIPTGGTYRSDYQFGPIFKYQPCNARLNITSTATGIATATPRRQLDILDASSAQLRLTYTDNSVYTDFTTNSSGNLLITPIGSVMRLTNSNTAFF